MTKVLVTGGCGFLGATLVPALEAQGCAVRVLDDLSAGVPQRLPPSTELIQGSVLDADAVKRAVESVDAVVHLAALTSVLDSLNDPWPGFEVNVRGTLTVLDQAAQASASCFLFASSNAAVGEQEPPITEEVASTPLSPYGASKAAGEAYCSAFAKSRGLRTVVLRFANAYGPHFEHKTSVIPNFFRSLRRGDPVTLYGDGKQTRDFIHVEDVAQAIVKAIAREDASGTFQIATETETSISELVRLMHHTTGIEPRIDHVPQPRGEIRRNYAGIARARRELGYSPVVPLAGGLDRTWRWFAESAADRGDSASTSMHRS